MLELPLDCCHDHQTHPYNSVNTKTKLLYQTNQISKIFYLKYHLCCQTVVPGVGGASVSVTPLDTTTFIYAKTFL